MLTFFELFFSVFEFLSVTLFFVRSTMTAAVDHNDPVGLFIPTTVSTFENLNASFNQLLPNTSNHMTNLRSTSYLR